VRYLALRDLLGRPAHDADLLAARAGAMQSGPAPAILAAQQPEGYWAKPGPGYSPKYRSTLWQILFLAQFGVDGGDERVRRGVEYAFAHAQTQAGAFACDGTPKYALHCLWGNVARALLDLGYWGDERLTRSVDALARSITGDGYGDYRSTGLQGPGFLCDPNYGLPCAWGAVRALWALAAVPAAGRTPAIAAAIEACATFLLRYDLAAADYPFRHKISPAWFELGYPLAYQTDVLHNLEALVEAGYSADARLKPAIELVLSKQDEQGRWKMKHTYRGRMWIDVEKQGRPSKWVTLRAVRMLKRLAEGEQAGDRLASGRG